MTPKVMAVVVFLMLFSSGCRTQGPEPTTIVPLEYPAIAAAANVQGEVFFWVLVDPEGKPKDVIPRRYDNVQMKAAAAENIAMWRWPIGTPTNRAIQVRFVFRLIEPGKGKPSFQYKDGVVTVVGVSPHWQQQPAKPG